MNGWRPSKSLLLIGLLSIGGCSPAPPEEREITVRPINALPPVSHPAVSIAIYEQESLCSLRDQPPRGDLPTPFIPRSYDPFGMPNPCLAQSTWDIPPRPNDLQAHGRAIAEAIRGLGLTGDYRDEVSFLALIDSAGAVEALELLQSSGVAAIDSLADDGLRDLPFRPALADGVPVPAVMGILFRVWWGNEEAADSVPEEALRSAGRTPNPRSIPAAHLHPPPPAPHEGLPAPAAPLPGSRNLR